MQSVLRLQLTIFLPYANYELYGRYLKDKRARTITRLMIRYERNHLKSLSLSTYFIVLAHSIKENCRWSVMSNRILLQEEKNAEWQMQIWGSKRIQEQVRTRDLPRLHVYLLNPFISTTYFSNSLWLYWFGLSTLMELCCTLILNQNIYKLNISKKNLYSFL